jgi:phosphomethylpyrimidine synthase
MVPFTEFVLSNGETHLLYDTAGSPSANPDKGLPEHRRAWVTAREGRGDSCFTQMHYARRGEITPEMEFVAIRENMNPGTISSRSTM